MADLKISQLTGATTPLAGTEVVPLVQSSTTKKVSVANLTAGRSVQVDKLGVNIAAPATQIHVQNTTEARVVTDASSNIIQLWKDAGASYAVAFGLNKPGAALGSQFKVSYTTGGAWTDGYTLDSSGNLKIDTGNLIQGTAAKGVNFTANTPAAGMTSQLLNWYEEGTWTPTFGRGSSDPTVTYTNQVGVYTRIGRQVIAVFDITASSISGGSGDAIIKGLPFPKGNLPSATFQYRDASAVPAGSAGQVLGSYSNSGDQIIYLQYENTGVLGYGTAGSVTGWNASGRINGWITYFV